MDGITYIQGDATAPNAEGPKIIAHVCNDIGKWGRGFVLAVSKRWPEVRADYLEWHRKKDGNLDLGSVQLIKVEGDLWVANMVGQRRIRRRGGDPPIRYEAVEQCLRTLAEHAVELSASVHMPRIGCGLAGAEWGRIEPLILQELSSKGVGVTVYDFGG